MQFNSYIFILLYLPVVVIGYLLLNKVHMKLGTVWLIIGGAVFYLRGGGKYSGHIGIKYCWKFDGCLSYAQMWQAPQSGSGDSSYRKYCITALL